LAASRRRRASSSPTTITRPDGEERARLAIREMAARKTDLVKIWLDGAGSRMPIKPSAYSGDEAQ
jgi:hypothetical protein